MNGGLTPEAVLLSSQLPGGGGLSPRGQPLGVLAQTCLHPLEGLAPGRVTLGFKFLPVLRLVCGHWLCPWLCSSETWDQVTLSRLSFGPHLPCPFSSHPSLLPHHLISALGVGDREMSRCLKMPAFFLGFLWGYMNLGQGPVAGWSGHSSGIPLSELWLLQPRGGSMCGEPSLRLLCLKRRRPGK